MSSNRKKTSPTSATNKPSHSSDTQSKSHHISGEITYNEKPFASGSYAYVHRGQYNGKDVAIKIQRKDRKDRKDRKKDCTVHFQNECLLLKRIAQNAKANHPYSSHVIPYHGFALISNTYLLIFDLLDLSLLDFISQYENMDDSSWLPLIQSIALDIAKGLHWLHHYVGILHRDLKSANILLKKVTDGVGYSAFICDFGLSDDSNNIHAAVGKGSLIYLPPEALNYKGPVTTKMDVYSYGCILYELIIRNEIFTMPKFNCVTVFSANLTAPLITELAQYELIVQPNKNGGLTASWKENNELKQQNMNADEATQVNPHIPATKQSDKIMITDKNLVKVISNSFKDCGYSRNTISTRDELISAVITHKKRPALPDDSDPTLKKLIKKCFHHEFKDRPTTSRIIAILEREISKNRNTQNSTKQITKQSVKINGDFYIDGSSSDDEFSDLDDNDSQNKITTTTSSTTVTSTTTLTSSSITTIQNNKTSPRFADSDVESASNSDNNTNQSHTAKKNNSSNYSNNSSHAAYFADKNKNKEKNNAKINQSPGKSKKM